MVSKKTTVWLVSTDDSRDAIYIDGKVAYQDHSISARDLMRVLEDYSLTDNFHFYDGGLTGDEANRRILESGSWPEDFADIAKDIS